jgi:hypothetical protein
MSTVSIEEVLRSKIGTMGKMPRLMADSSQPKKMKVRLISTNMRKGAEVIIVREENMTK